MSRLNIPFTQHLDDAGNPLIDGLLHFYEVGTATLKDTYVDAELTIPNSNPVLLSGSGREPNIYGSGTYKVTLSDSLGAQIEERDNVGSDTSAGYGSEWDSTITYNIPQVVQHEGFYYQSLTNNNLDNAPDLSPASWELKDSRIVTLFQDLGGVGDGVVVDWSGTGFQLSDFDLIIIRGTADNAVTGGGGDVCTTFRSSDLIGFGRIVIGESTRDGTSDGYAFTGMTGVTQTQFTTIIKANGSTYAASFIGIYGVNI